jgi:hypothetical protein
MVVTDRKSRNTPRLPGLASRQLGYSKKRIAATGGCRLTASG